jgi:hypothetical protein
MHLDSHVDWYKAPIRDDSYGYPCSSKSALELHACRSFHTLSYLNFKIVQLVVEKSAPDVPKDIPVALQRLLEKCLSFAEKDRPTASEVMEVGYSQKGVSRPS